MPSIVNEFLLEELTEEIKGAGSCLVLSFDRLTVSEVSDLRNQLRDSGVSYKVVKNRLAAKAFKNGLDLDLSSAFSGKCGVITAPEEGVISAAKLVRESTKKQKDPKICITGGVIEGEAILGKEAEAIPDMPDRDTVNAQLAGVIAGPARALATVTQGVASGLARVIQAKMDKEAG
ncbi:MAG: 50S ribosomal protein L10 [Planctomycetota bacterium]|jgi:large subunit ribosomal protein L10